MAYFHLNLDSEPGISGDDLNRRHREQRLGYAAPSKDWALAGEEIHCIYPNQVITRPTLDNAPVYVHANPAYFNPGNMLEFKGIRIVKDSIRTITIK